MKTPDTGVSRRASRRISGAWVAIPLITVGLWLASSAGQYWAACWSGWSAACQDMVLYGDLSWMYAFVWGAQALCLVGAAITRPWRWFLGAVPVLAVANVVDVFSHWSADITEWYGILTGIITVAVGAFLLVQPYLSAGRSKVGRVAAAPA